MTPLDPTDGQPADQRLHAATDAVLIHDQAVRDTERPRVDIDDGRALVELLPESEVDLLHDVGGLLFGDAEAASEVPDALQ